MKEHDVKILDMRIDRNLMKKLSDFKPGVAGITAYTFNVKTVKNILKEIKKHDSSIKTFIGGIHATFVPSDFAKPIIDTIFLGYADHSFKEYINTLEAGEYVKSIKNLVLVKGDEIFYTERHPVNVNLDSLPMPA